MWTYVLVQPVQVAAQTSMRRMSFLLRSTAGCMQYNVSSLKDLVRIYTSFLASVELQQSLPASYMCILTIMLLTLYCMQPAVHNKPCLDITSYKYAMQLYTI